QAIRQLSGQDISSDIEITDPVVTKIQPVKANDLSTLPEITGGSVGITSPFKNINALDVSVNSEIINEIITHSFYGCVKVALSSVTIKAGFDSERIEAGFDSERIEATIQNKCD
ncbi:MAG: hypothetical protein KAR20_10295, partial [Candidatus Heimdallarchaeota archaeon]|nr:hypothetical protein [Candidatus Heimdallarchaeota archaeon]